MKFEGVRLGGVKARAAENHVREKERDLLETTQPRSHMGAASSTLLCHISFTEIARGPKSY